MQYQANNNYASIHLQTVFPTAQRLSLTKGLSDNRGGISRRNEIPR